MRLTRALIVFESPYPVLPKNASIPEPLRGELLSALLLDSVERFSAIESVHTVFHPDRGRPPEELRAVRESIDVRVRDDETPLEAAMTAIGDCFEEGYRFVMFFDARHPGIPAHRIEGAFSLLDMYEDAVVVAPTTRGGCYAVGLRHPDISLLAGVDLRSPDFFSETIRRVRAADTAVYLLAARDDPASLPGARRLLLELRGGATQQETPPRTAALLEQHARTLLPER
jgi:hypothetical protein